MTFATSSTAPDASKQSQMTTPANGLTIDMNTSKLKKRTESSKICKEAQMLLNIRKILPAAKLGRKTKPQNKKKSNMVIKIPIFNF